MTNSDSKRLVVIGGGPGGFAAAVDAAAHGLSVTLIEKGDLGGTCLNVGCIPTKLFLGATAAMDELADQAKVRVASGTIAVDIPALQNRKARLLEATRKAMAKRLADLGVTLVRGEARFAAPDAVAVTTSDGEERIGFSHCILAAGSAPGFFPGMAIDAEVVLTSDHLLAVERAPESLVIVGGGVIGLEFGQIFARFGTKITIVEAMERILPSEDPDVSASMQQYFKRKGWTFLTGKRVSSLAAEDGKAVCRLESGEVIESQQALVSVGRKSVAQAFAPEAAGIELSPRGWVVTDEHLRAAPNIHAVGDVNGRILLAHAAEAQGRYAVEAILGRETGPFDATAMPGIVYGEPDSMRVGRMAHELVAAGQPVSVSVANIAANPIAQAAAMTHGFVKVVWSGDAIVGVTAVGPHVSQLAMLAQVMVRQAWDRERALSFIFPHPTIDESLLDAIKAERKDVTA